MLSGPPDKASAARKNMNSMNPVQIQYQAVSSEIAMLLLVLIHETLQSKLEYRIVDLTKLFGDDLELFRTGETVRFCILWPTDRKNTDLNMA